MKTIHEMTEIEINNLNDEEIEKLVVNAKLENGIKFIKKPIEPKYEEINVEKTNSFKVCNLYDFQLLDESEATKLCNLLESFKSMVRTDYTFSSNYRFVKKYELNVGISKENIYSDENYQIVKDILKRNDTLRKDYEYDLKEYNENESFAKDIIQAIYDIISEVKGKFYRLDLHTNRFRNEYLPLAENDTNKAMLFYKKAYSLTEEEENYIIENL